MSETALFLAPWRYTGAFVLAVALSLIGTALIVLVGQYLENRRFKRQGR